MPTSQHIYSACLYLCIVLLLVAAKKHTELEIIVEHKPSSCPDKAESGDLVAVHYTGRLDTGAIFDSSVQQGRDPIQFQLGSGKVIPGWEQGILGMCVGERRKLVIPPHLAYGPKGQGPIPGEATLTFETELITVQKGSGGEHVGFDDTIYHIISFMAIPVVILIFVFYLWDKVKKAPTNKERKSDKKGKKKR